MEIDLKTRPRRALAGKSNTRPEDQLVRSGYLSKYPPVLFPRSRPLYHEKREVESQWSPQCSRQQSVASSVRRTRTRDVVNMATTILIPALLALMLLPLLGAAADTDSLYKALKEHGLPAGLIPNSVKNYILSENGEFKVELAEACYAQIEEPVCYTSFLFADLA